MRGWLISDNCDRWLVKLDVPDLWGGVRGGWVWVGGWVGVGSWVDG